MQQTSGSNIFDDIQKRIIIKEINDSFCKRGYMITEVSFLEYSEEKITVKITTSDKNKIVVEKDMTKMNWKLNALPMGEVIGREIADVAGSYECEKVKDRR